MRSDDLRRVKMPDKTNKKVRNVCYNFMINENLHEDSDTALHPELLGKVFENHLASYTKRREKGLAKAVLTCSSANAEPGHGVTLRQYLGALGLMLTTFSSKICAYRD